VKAGAPQAIRMLHEGRAEDRDDDWSNHATATAVAAQLGIDEFEAEVLPEHKAGKVAALQAQGRRVQWPAMA